MFVVFLLGIVMVIYKIAVRREGQRARPRVKHLTHKPASVLSREPDSPSFIPPAPARTGANETDEETSLSAAVRTGAPGACVREGVPIIAFSEHRMQQAARRMIRHKMSSPTADMLDTIRAGFPEIKSRSGDPGSKYQRYGKPMYDALFSEPEEDFPTLAAQRKPSLVER
jgi:hypothetical protein